MTNGDKIRAMTDEELEKWLDGIAGCFVCTYMGCKEFCSSSICVKNKLKWLKQECKDDDSD